MPEGAGGFPGVPGLGLLGIPLSLLLYIYIYIYMYIYIAIYLGGVCVGCVEFGFAGIAWAWFGFGCCGLMNNSAQFGEFST